MRITIGASVRLSLFLLAVSMIVPAEAFAKDRSDRQDNKRVSRDAEDDDDEKDERRSKKRRKGAEENAAGTGRIVLPNLSASFATEEQRQLGLLLGKALYWDEQIGSGNGNTHAHPVTQPDCHRKIGLSLERFPQADQQVPKIRGSLGVRYAQFIALKMDEVSGQEVSAAVELFTEPGNTRSRIATLHQQWQ